MPGDLTIQELQKQIAELFKTLAEIKTSLAAVPNDGVKKDELEKVVADLTAKMEALQKKEQAAAAASMVPTVDFGDGAKNVGFQQFMKMVMNGDPRVKTIVSVNETTGADGGIVVPTAFSNKIIEIALNASVIANKATPVPMSVWKTDVPKQLTDVSVAWVAENGGLTLQKPTLSKITLALGSISAVIAYTIEQLMDQVVDLSVFYEQRIGKKMGQTIDAKILEGDSDSDLADGIKNADDVVSTTFTKPVTYDDIVDLWNSQTVEDYHTGAEWTMNRAALGILLKFKDDNGVPLFGSLVNGVPTMLLNKPYNLTDQVAGSGTLASKTSIYYGNFANVWLLNHSKFPGMTVESTNAGVSPATGTPQQNAFLHRQKWFRYDLRRGYIIPEGKAFVRGLNVWK